MQWIRPYHSAMSEWEKKLHANTFAVPAEDNTECIILVATDAYGMEINNPDVRLVIQWDIPISFDLMIQRMGRAGRKGRASVFVLFTPKWTKVKDPDEIEKRKAGALSFTLINAQLSDSNRPKASPLSQTLNAEDTFGDSKSTAGSEVGSEAGSDAEFDEEADLFLEVLATKVDQDRKQKKKKLKASQTDASKCAKLPNEIFDYIHVTRCQRLSTMI